MLDVVGDADAVEDMRAKEAAAGAVAVLGQISKGHAIVGEHGMDLVGKDLDYGLEEGSAFHLPGAFVELDIGELRDPPMATNITSLPSAWRSSQLSMWT